MARNVNLTLSTDEIDFIRMALCLDMSMNSVFDDTLSKLEEHKNQVEDLYTKLRKALIAG